MTRSSSTNFWDDSAEKRTGRIRGVTEPYVLSSQSLQLDEPSVLTDPRKGLAVYRIVRPLAVRSETTGLYGDLWSGQTAMYSRFGCRTGQVLLVTVGDDAKLRRRLTTLLANGRRYIVPHGAIETFAVPLRAVGSRCDVRFSVDPVAQPSSVEAGSTDTRVLGLRFIKFAVR